MSRGKGPNVKGGGSEARKRAAAILEVLAGELTPADAATALNISLSRYYVLETRALESLVAGCEPRSKGGVRGPERELAVLRKEHERLKRDHGRMQSLTRVAQRAAGFNVPRPKKKPMVKGKRRRKPVVRAMRAAERLQSSFPAVPVESQRQEQAKASAGD